MPKRRESGFPPALKRFGQHFLADARVLHRIADALELSGSETVIEIGPGRGALTELLATRCRRLIAVEIDRALAEGLRTAYATQAHVEIVEGDVLQMNLAELAGEPYVLAGNVPYYITTPIIFQSLQPPQPLRSVFLVQREVAERMTAQAGSGDYGALTVNVQAVAVPELLFVVPARAFRPPPKVESAVVRLRPRALTLIEPARTRAFQAFVQSLFGMRRKQLQRVLRSTHPQIADRVPDILSAGGWDPTARPETLPPEDMVRLFERVTRGPD